MLAANGTPPKVWQTLARHASTRTTLRYYVHTTDEQQAAAVAALPDFTPADQPKVIRRPA
jgi:hypothetical protein